MNVFTRAMDGGYKNFYQFMAEQFVETHEIYLGKIEKAYNLDKIFQSFLRPSILGE